VPADCGSQVAPVITNISARQRSMPEAARPRPAASSQLWRKARPFPWLASGQEAAMRSRMMLMLSIATSIHGGSLSCSLSMPRNNSASR